MIPELLLPIAYIASVARFSPFLRSFENDPDEGLNVIKGALLRSGSHLYSDTWSDQPPYFTNALSMLWSATGESVVAARLLVLASAALLLWALMRMARRSWGVDGGFVTGTLLLLLPDFQRLSVSVMVGLPALALSTAALALLLEWQTSPRWPLAAGSGALLGLAIFTKLSAALLLPVLSIAFALGAPRRERPAGLLAWGLGLGAASLPAAFQILGTGGVQQLLEAHLLATQVTVYRAVGGLGSLFGSSRLVLLAGLALAGVAITWRSRLPIVRLAALWSVLALFVLAWHRPLWYHQRLLLGVPLSLLATPAILAGWRWFLGRLLHSWHRRRQARLGVAAAAVLALARVVAVDGDWRRVEPRELDGLLTAEGHPVLDRLESVAKPEDLILTDRPMFAFRAGLRVPPEAAVISDKRLRTGLLSERDLLELLHSSSPALVLLERFSLPDLEFELQQEYRLAHARRHLRLFVERSPEFPPGCRWPDCADLPDSWYRGAAAARVMRSILASQREDGGWAAGEDRTVEYIPAAADLDCDGQRFEGCSTVAGGATTAELRFLGRMIRITADRALVHAFERGLDYLIRSQHPSGAWSTVEDSRLGSFPSRLVVKNRASASVVDLLLEISEDPSFSFVDDGRRERAATGAQLGITFFLRTQVAIGSVRTIWSSYYDPGTLQPSGGRRREPPMLVVEDSVEVLRVLLRAQPSSRDLEVAIRAGFDWLEKSRVKCNGEACWYRFHDLDSGWPILEEYDGVPWRRVADSAPWGTIGGRHFTTEPGALLRYSAQTQDVAVDGNGGAEPMRRLVYR